MPVLVKVYLPMSRLARFGTTMSNDREEAQMRAHLAEMRRGVSGLGRDFALEFKDIDRKIERLGTATAREARMISIEIQNDFANLGRSIDDEMRRIPQRIADAGVAIGSGAAWAAGATRDAAVAAGHRAKEGTKNALATAAGVKRTPIRQWHSPDGSDAGSSDSASQ
ncbi:MAG: hypothetical protein WB778_05210 [Thermoplasmata archaeon]